MGGLLSITQKTITIKGNTKTDTGITCKGMVIAKPSNSNTLTLFVVSTAANLIEEIKTLGDVIGVNSSLPLNISVENNTLHVNSTVDADRYLYLTMIQ